MNEERRKVHPKERTNIFFYKDNLRAGRKKVNLGIIISDFIISKQYDKYKLGVPFYVCITEMMIVKYGSFDVFRNNELKDLKDIFKFRLEGFK